MNDSIEEEGKLTNRKSGGLNLLKFFKKKTKDKSARKETDEDLAQQEQQSALYDHYEPYQKNVQGVYQSPPTKRSRMSLTKKEKMNAKSFVDQQADVMQSNYFTGSEDKPNLNNIIRHAPINQNTN